MKITKRQLRRVIVEAVEAAYSTSDYLPGLKRLRRQLSGFQQELRSATFGNQTETIHREIADAVSSLNLAVAALEETAVEYEAGPWIKPRSERINPDGTFIKQASFASDD